jgi:hypothetical protein
MSTARETAGKGAPHEKEHHTAKRERSRHAAHEDIQQLIFTLDVATGGVVKIEKVDSAGKRHEMPREETIALAGKDNLHEIEAALDEAFEAGISSVLEPAEDDDADEESEEEMELRRVLLTGIIGRDVRRRLQRRLVQRLILSRTLRH